MTQVSPIIIIIGSTGVGKTSFSYRLAEYLNNQAIIINGDMAQLYSDLSVGTAKPDVHQTPLTHYLFGCLTQPISYNVAEYRNKVSSIMQQDPRQPILVGGSTLYMHSLFFDYSASSVVEPRLLERFNSMSNQELWSELAEFDCVRATQLHPNDRYRLQRALILTHGGKKASLQKPLFKPLGPSVLIHLITDRSVLKIRLVQRMLDMLNNGWIQEVESLLGSEWQEFWEQKKIIGYKNIATFITKQSKMTFEQLQEDILLQTMQYAKKQDKYWRMLKRSITMNDPLSHKVVHYTLEQSESPLYLEKIAQSIAAFQKEIL